ncbi:colicin V secretion protein CvaA [Brenneria goodwinii]|uniref:Colicin V secretion protein CvaA n=1 Tax=Brenneria goodwinii TaxID=1109412 RepID=A0AAE8EKG0_9GAMM|nr:HlyD family secretion protein [Brenneria goodwinii]ATA25963.1 colicin V secretion protein CvaA [Brenneria goodwinii]RLM16943.1 colicin V secretion protein CvaA [Brenneria goodwinii]
MLFRQEAVDYRKNLWSGKALLAPGIPAWLVSTFTLLFFICFITFLIFGTYTRRINVTGELISSPRAVTVFSAQQGFVISQLVNPGDRVTKGQALYQIDVSRTTTSGVVSKKQREDIERQISAIDRIIEKIRENKEVTLNMLKQQQISYKTALQHSSDVLKKAEEGLRIMKENMENYKVYQRKGLINKDQMTSQASLYYQQQNDLLGLSGQNEQNALQVLTLQGNIRTQEADFDNQIYQLEIQKNDLTRQITDVDAGSILVVSSPVDGRIDSLSVTPGQMIGTGDSLLQIIPGDTRSYVLVLWVPDSAVPYLSPGDRLNIRYDAFPAERFGQFPGKILFVSSTPASLQEMATYPGAPGRTADKPQTWYKVVVSPQSSQFRYRGKQLEAENGMKATSTLFLENRTLYQWLLSPLYDISTSAQGPVNGK